MRNYVEQLSELVKVDAGIRANTDKNELKFKVSVDDFIDGIIESVNKWRYEQCAETLFAALKVKDSV